MSSRQVFGTDIETCPACGGAVRTIAYIEDAEVSEKLLAHLEAKAAEPEAVRRSNCDVAFCLEGPRGRVTYTEERNARGAPGEDRHLLGVRLPA